MSGRYHEVVEFEKGSLICDHCQEPMIKGEAFLQYMGNQFPLLLPQCPTCGLTFVPEDLATGKILEVEQALEDK